MEIVVPLGEKERALVRPGSGEEPRLVGVVLEHEMHEAITAGPFGHRARQLGEHVVARAVRHGMHGVQAQAVQVELVEPVERVVHDEGPRDLAARRVEVEGVAPRSLAVAAEERRGVPRKIVALRPEVVVDHVEKDGEPSGVTGLDERLEILRLSVRRRRGRKAAPRHTPSPSDRGNPPRA